MSVTKEMIEDVTAELLAHGEFGSTAERNRLNAEVAAKAVLALSRSAEAGKPVVVETTSPQSNLVGWQTIDSAPKDGTMIWVLDALYNQPWHYECRWNGIQWYHGFGTAWPRANPTYWMPLPPSPSASEDQL